MRSPASAGGRFGDANGLASQRERVTAVQKAVRADAGERPNTAAGESFEHRRGD